MNDPSSQGTPASSGSASPRPPSASRLLVRAFVNAIPLALLFALALLLAWAWLFWDTDRQMKVLLSLASALVGGALFLIWCVLLSPLRRRTRVGIAIGAIIVIGGSATLFRIEQVTGDMVPIIGWRFAKKPDRALEATPLPPDTSSAPVPPPRVRSDWRQFLGDNRDGKARWIEIARNWREEPPIVVWRRKIGSGWSGFAVAGDIAVTQEQRGENELVTAYALTTGDPLWSHSDAGRYETVLGGIGPRATPTISGDRVYTLGSLGRLSCLELESGQPVWSRDIAPDKESMVPEWGLSSSPLLTDDLCIVTVAGSGSSLLAFDRESGEPRWSEGDASYGYSSPSLHTVAGVPQILVLNGRSVAAHAPDTGRVLWREDWPGSRPKVAQPVPIGSDRVLVSAGYGIGCALFEIAAAADGSLTSKAIWKTKSLKAKFSNFFELDGYVYGLDDGIMVCLDPATGERRWKAGRIGHGQLIATSDLIIATVETTGEIALIEPNPDEYRELIRVIGLDDKMWNPPALAAPYLLIRTDKEAACLELPLLAD